MRRTVLRRAGLLLIMVIACTGAARPDAPAASQPAFKLAPWPHAVPTPQFELQDTDGHLRTPASFSGSVMVIYFGFLSCPDQCPATLLKLSRVMKQLGQTRPPVTVLFVTLDPEHDSPGALKQYVRAFDPRFVALTGNREAVDRAAAAFFVQHARVRLADGSETIDHSTGLFLLDDHGRLRAVGSTQSKIDDLTHDLRVLTAAAGSPAR
ncbi:MAG TPA: SCO family protein [Steroidobacteraceae bacterium]